MRDWLPFLFVVLPFFLCAQINADQKFISDQKIKTAKFTLNDPAGQHSLYYTQQGTLYKERFSSWDGGYDASGSVSIMLYDSVGRLISIQDYLISDSLELYSDAAPALKIACLWTAYSGDTLITETDTSWNKYQQVISTKTETTISHWQKTPCPYKMHPATWPDYIEADQFATSRILNYTYADTLSQEPLKTTEIVWLTMSANTMNGSTLTGEVLSDLYRNDSAFHTRTFSVSTLHGHTDTITFTEYRNANRIEESSNVYSAQPNVSIGYVKMKKRFGRYYVKYNLFGRKTDHWNKFTSKEPWLDYRFVGFNSGPWYSWPPDEYKTVQNFISRNGTKPVYTYY